MITVIPQYQQWTTKLFLGLLQRRLHRRDFSVPPNKVRLQLLLLFLLWLHSYIPTIAPFHIAAAASRKTFRVIYTPELPFENDTLVDSISENDWANLRLQHCPYQLLFFVFLLLLHFPLLLPILFPLFSYLLLFLLFTLFHILHLHLFLVLDMLFSILLTLILPPLPDLSALFALFSKAPYSAITILLSPTVLPVSSSPPTSFHVFHLLFFFRSLSCSFSWPPVPLAPLQLSHR